MSFNKDIPYNDLPDLPPIETAIETPAILRQVVKASRHLGELNGLCTSLPDPQLLINTLVLQESKDSSAIENIVLYQPSAHLYFKLIAY